MRATSIVFVTVTVLVGCTDEARRPTGAAVAVWTIDESQTVTVSAVAPDGELQLEHPVGGTRLADGTIVVADGMAPAVRFFSKAGVLLQSVGRRGRGPGEMLSLVWLGRCGPRVVTVWDRTQGQLISLDDFGGLVRQHQLPMGHEGEVAPAFLSCSESGTYVAVGQPTPGITDGPFAQFFGPIMIGRTSDQMRSIGVSTVVTEWSTEARQSRPLGARSFVAAAPDRFFVAMTESSSVAIYDLDGVRTGTVSVETPPRSPTAAHIQAAAEALTVAIGNVDLGRRIQERAILIPPPAVAPPFGGVFVDPTGLLWVQLTIPGDTTTHLRAFNGDGVAVADMHLPSSLAVFEVGVDHVVGRHEDINGVMHVVVYRYRRNAA